MPVASLKRATDKSTIKPAQIPDATPQLNAVQRVGGSIGTAVLVVAVQRGITLPRHAFHISFGLLLATTVLALVSATVLTMVLGTGREARSVYAGR